MPPNMIGVASQSGENVSIVALAGSLCKCGPEPGSSLTLKAPRGYPGRHPPDESGRGPRAPPTVPWSGAVAPRARRPTPGCSRRVPAMGLQSQARAQQDGGRTLRTMFRCPPDAGTAAPRWCPADGTDGTDAIAPPAHRAHSLCSGVRVEQMRRTLATAPAFPDTEPTSGRAVREPKPPRVRVYASVGSGH